MDEPETIAVDRNIIADLYTRVQALEAWRTHQSDVLDDLLNGGTAPDADDGPDGESTIDIDALTRWVEECVTTVIARPLRGELTWCPRWRDHAEAVLRLEALRRAWLELATEPGVAMSLWIRDHLDPCLRELTSPLGPFADCTPAGRDRGRHPHTPVPTLSATDTRAG